MDERPVIEETAIRIEVEEGDPVKDVMDAMMQGIGELLKNEAMVFPVHMSALSCNGSGQLVRYTRTETGGDATVLAEYDKAPGWSLPIHVLLMDSTGYTARVILTERKKGS